MASWKVLISSALRIQVWYSSGAGLLSWITCICRSFSVSVSASAEEKSSASENTVRSFAPVGGTSRRTRRFHRRLEAASLASISPAVFSYRSKAPRA